MPDINVLPCGQLGSMQVPMGGGWIYLDGVWIRMVHTIKDADEENGLDEQRTIEFIGYTLETYIPYFKETSDDWKSTVCTTLETDPWFVCHKGDCWELDVDRMIKDVASQRLGRDDAGLRDDEAQQQNLRQPDLPIANATIEPPLVSNSGGGPSPTLKAHRVGGGRHGPARRSKETRPSPYPVPAIGSNWASRGISHGLGQDVRISDDATQLIWAPLDGMIPGAASRLEGCDQDPQLLIPQTSSTPRSSGHGGVEGVTATIEGTGDGVDMGATGSLYTFNTSLLFDASTAMADMSAWTSEGDGARGFSA
ncbi:hypothetical protein CONPUDRAFT_159099 [Coniophora puteana RWD-64-598 SS2]|uniref:Uncharacterized protein n=1 Tax=Coniophora puteana (strain RWD-64-598) TaxID=741705 RepID=A0A5M3MAK3_CONPW|nr:uncharacterized protein CONPUDRAFT_159099 [Coniophora puteana RWD-64-598 SS2]EIW75655.1 hypothetical protein CONPUDRAFT_159099 [Coniophora puteana RWD-64-598 SS2]